MFKTVGAFGVLGAFSAAFVFACSSNDTVAAGPDSSAPDTGAADSNPGKKDSGIFDSGMGPDTCNMQVPTLPSNIMDAGDLVQCDPVAQNCTDPCSPKCSFFPIEAGTSVAGGNFVACGPQPGNGKLDEGCTRPTDVAGYDTCGKGFSCVSFSTPANASTLRTCRPTCTAKNPCAMGDFCVSMTPPQLMLAQGGVCAHSCDPWTTKCASGDGCIDYTDINNNLQLTCGVIGQTAIGQPCQGGNACVAGAACWQVGDSGTSSCMPYCDMAHPCSSGVCTTPTMGATFKLCM